MARPRPRGPIFSRRCQSRSGSRSRSAGLMLARYIELGWDLKLIPAGEKGPRLQGWPDLKTDPRDLARHLAAGGNIGVRLGRRSSGLVDADLDCLEALDLVDLYLPATAAIFGRRSKPRSHRFYIAHGALKAAFADPLDGTTLVELRADGRDGAAHQTVIPPSIVGERREWCGAAIEPAVVDAVVLARRVAWLAIGC